MNPGRSLQVECYSGYKADERPVRFRLAERTCEMVEVQDRWYGPGCAWFRVLADDGNVYILRRTDVAQDARWTLEGFRSQ